MRNKIYVWLAASLLLGFLSPAWAIVAADLTIASGSPTVTPSMLSRGATITLPSWTLRNQGEAMASNFQVLYYLSTDTVITTADTHLN